MLGFDADRRSPSKGTRRRKDAMSPKSQASNGNGNCDEKGDNDHDSKKKRHSRVSDGVFHPCLRLIRSWRQYIMVICSILAALWRSDGIAQFRQGAKRISMGVIIVIVFSFVSLLKMSQRHRMVDENLPIIIRRFDFSDVDDLGGWLYPLKPFPSYRTLLPSDEDEEAGQKNKPDYGGIQFRSLVGSNFQRTINKKHSHFFENFINSESHLLVAEKKNKEQNYDDDTFYFNAEDGCRRRSWQYSYKPNCNMFHEIDLSRDVDEEVAVGYVGDYNYDIYHISSGYWRDVWDVRNIDVPKGDDDQVLKTLRWKHKFNFGTHNEIHIDALVMEQLSASPRIINMYGHCETSVSVEPMVKELEEFVVPHGFIDQKDLNDKDDVDPQNKFTATEKLNIALAMAESLADLHGFKDGMIIHDDVQLCQWLWDKNGKLRLGDFNRAELSLWSEKDQKYCKHYNGMGWGNWRSPEEYEPDDLDETIDVYSFGNNIYALLTGLWVFYEIEDDEVVKKHLLDEERGFVDERYRARSYAEGVLVEVMEKCWSQDPKDRISIFEAVDILKKAVIENTRREANAV
mmetsp:Transcript_2119/g.3365  ORF Transcript_2119/g.3365 Transcript_2119/m.3365 type:complete len:571 (-) Transcript_2119:209-1921(-)